MSKTHQELYASHRLFKYWWTQIKGRVWNSSFLAGEEWVACFNLQEKEIQRLEAKNKVLMDLTIKNTTRNDHGACVVRESKEAIRKCGEIDEKSK